MAEISDKALELRRAYNRQYQNEYVKNNRDKVNQRARDYYKRHPDKVKATQAKYWERKAQQIKE